jgi:transcriptional regulator with XRE-family HTH domain
MRERFSPTAARRFRLEKGDSKAQIAVNVGVTEQTVQGWELGYRSPSLAAVIALAESLGVRVADLIEADADACPEPAA